MMLRRSREWTGQAIERLETRRTPSEATGLLQPMSNFVADSPVFVMPRLATTPADGDSIDASDSPSALTFRLGGPPGLWSDQGIELHRIGPDGSESTILDRNSDALGLVQADGSVTLALPGKLEPGRYRIVLVGGSGLAFTFSQGRWDPTEDRTIAEFRVKAPAGVMDLGVVGPDVKSVAGSLDGAGDGAESFRFRLGPRAGLYSLALQLDAERIGSALTARLDVFDAGGRQVASVPIGADLPSKFPNDPYLFAGLAPGDYVVVVSKPAGAPAGAFNLNLTAEPVTGPTRIVDLKLNRSGGSPSGFTIQFSSPIEPTRLRSDSMYVVDSSGSLHAVQLVDVGAGLTSATFGFLGSLPAGEYSLVAAGARPIADLIGRIPIANGLAAGILGRWTITPEEAASGSGVGLPTAGIVGAGSLDAAPGLVIEIPITLGPDGSLVLVSNLDAGAMKVEVLGGPDGPIEVTPGTGTPSSELWVHPGAGVFTIRITSIGVAPLAGSWRLLAGEPREASIVANAIGSRGAIGLRLGAEAPAPGTPAPGSPGGSSPESSQPFAPGNGTGGLATSVAARSEMGPSPWAYGAGSSLVGRPSSSADAVTPVGPTAPGGLTAVAWAAPGANGLGSSLILSTSVQADDGVPRGPAGSPEPPQEAATRDDQVARSGADADDDALRQADRVAEAVRSGFRWLLGVPQEAEPAAPASADVDGLAIAQAEAAGSDADGSDGKVERSALDLPFTVLLLTATTLHLRRLTHRWWGKRKAAARAARPVDPIPKPLFRGPRRMTAGNAATHAQGPRRG